MEIAEKKKIKEILALYTFEPTLTDIYVEGKMDKLLIERFLKINEVTKFSVIEIDSIDFSDVYDKTPDLKKNNKNKLIELSRQLEIKNTNNVTKVMCIVDKDFDDFLNKIIKNNYLKYTDYSCLEMYLFNKDCMDIFLKNIIRNFPITANKTLIELGKVLQEKFLIRLAFKINYKGKEKLKITDLKKSISINKKTGEIRFDYKVHLKKILHANKLNSDEKIYLDTIKKYDNKCSHDVRNQIRGHDFTHMLFLYVKKIKGSLKLGEELLDGILFQCLDINSLHSYKLFTDIYKLYK